MSTKAYYHSVDSSELILAYAVHPADCLRLNCRVQQRLYEEDVRGLDYIQAVGAAFKRQQHCANIRVLLEKCEALADSLASLAVLVTYVCMYVYI